MNLLTYISDVPRRNALAEAIGANPHYLWQIATRWKGRRASPALAEKIESATKTLGPETVTKESVIFGAAENK